MQNFFAGQLLQTMRFEARPGQRSTHLIIIHNKPYLTRGVYFIRQYDDNFPALSYSQDPPKNFCKDATAYDGVNIYIFGKRGCGDNFAIQFQRNSVNFQVLQAHRREVLIYALTESAVPM